MLEIFAHLDLELHPMDVFTVILNGDLDENVFMEGSEGLHGVERKSTIYKLLKSLYGLNKSPRDRMHVFPQCWNT